MKVKELREAIEDLDDDVELTIVEAPRAFLIRPVTEEDNDPVD